MSFTNDCDNIEERYLLDSIRMLQESYQRAAKPYIDRLVLIRSRRAPVPLMILREQANALGLLPLEDRNG